MKRLALLIILSCILVFVNSFAFTIDEHKAEYVQGEIIVKFKDVTPEYTKRSVIQNIETLEVRETYRKIFTVIKVPEHRFTTIIQALNNNPSVDYTQPNYIYRAHVLDTKDVYSDDPLCNNQWNFEMINLEEAWALSTGDGVVVAVLDSGVHSKGKDGFGDRLLRGYNAFLNLEAFWYDTNSHGTHVSGTIAQETNNGIGVAGIAFSAKILPIKVLNRLLVGTTDLAASGIGWATDNGADIINMSFGSPNLSEDDDRILKEMIDYAYDMGVTLIASSGNLNQSRYFTSDIDFPARYANVIAVGAVDFRGERAPYSNFGPSLDLVAPGGDRGWPGRGILQETFFQHLGFLGYALGWDYYYYMGTSMASAHVTGVAALIKSTHLNWGPDEIKKAMTETALDLGVEGKDDFYGYGLIDAEKAVKY
jgi:serine protease